jgi:hypothetical protein
MFRLFQPHDEKIVPVDKSGDTSRQGLFEVHSMKDFRYGHNAAMKTDLACSDPERTFSECCKKKRCQQGIGNIPLLAATFTNRYQEYF